MFSFELRLEGVLFRKISIVLEVLGELAGIFTRLAHGNLALDVGLQLLVHPLLLVILLLIFLIILFLLLFIVLLFIIFLIIFLVVLAILVLPLLIVVVVSLLLVFNIIVRIGFLGLVKGMIGYSRPTPRF
jgi:hypothetical protein